MADTLLPGTLGATIEDIIDAANQLREHKAPVHETCQEIIDLCRHLKKQSPPMDDDEGV